VCPRRKAAVSRATLSNGRFRGILCYFGNITKSSCDMMRVRNIKGTTCSENLLNSMVVDGESYGIV
jgi:hypothetical protein